MAQIQQKLKSTKAKVAAVGATLTAILVALGPLGDALDDGSVSVGEATTLAGVLVTLVATVYGVWRVENKPADNPYAGQQP